MSKHDREKKAKIEGKLFLLAGSCNNGHRLKSRSGHCIQCKTDKITYIRNHTATGYVYIAASKTKQMIKVGFAQTIIDREKTLNSSKYASCEDWEILKYAKIDNAGNHEGLIHSDLNPYFASEKYWKQNRWQPTNEVFSCSFLTALNSFEKNIQHLKIYDEKKIDVKLFKTYCDFPNKLRS